MVQAYGIDQILNDSTVLDLEGVRTIFPGAPKEVFNRLSGPINILIGSMYRSLQPFGGEESFTRRRLRLVKSLFGCGFILTALILLSWPVKYLLLNMPENDLPVP